MSSIILDMFRNSSSSMYPAIIIPPCFLVLKVKQDPSTITLLPSQPSRGFCGGLGSLA
ncbi:uncharacterized protein DS421_14g448630 [Arachis hypogaea]|nr:uncharacterized protein DS421_14g448630 [Arachis hypogaea]